MSNGFLQNQAVVSFEFLNGQFSPHAYSVRYCKAAFIWHLFRRQYLKRLQL